MPSQQNRYFLVTASYAKSRCDLITGELLTDPWTPETFYADNDDVVWVTGQQEIGDSGYHHYQFMFSVKKKVTLTKAMSYFPKYLSPHIEPSRSEAAEAYVHKAESRVADTEFELGVNLDEFIAHR